MSDDEREAMVMASVRVPKDVLARADKLAAKLAAGDPLGRQVTRTDVLRAALESGLAALERKGKR